MPLATCTLPSLPPALRLTHLMVLPEVSAAVTLVPSLNLNPCFSRVRWNARRTSLSCIIARRAGGSSETAGQRVWEAQVRK